MQSKYQEQYTNLKSVKTQQRENWMQYLYQARRVYFFQKWADKRKDRSVSLDEIAQWIYTDIRHIVRWNINILLQIRAYGDIIKKTYGVSFFRQWYRMVYIVLFLRTTATRFRTAHLFDENHWKQVEDFSYGRHFNVMDRMLGYPHHDELKIITDKFQFFKFCTEKGIRTPKVLAVFEDGEISYPSNRDFQIPSNDLFMKELAGGMGRGARKFTFNNGRFFDRFENVFTKDELLNFLIQYSKTISNIIVQPAINNHKTWKKFTSGGLATCRIVTGISATDKHEIEPLLAVMKMPNGNIDADNSGKGSVMAPIDVESGMMSSCAAFRPIDGSFTFEAHPDTGYTFTGDILPSWNEILEFVKDLHKQFNTHSIGWDLSLTEDGISVIEGNIEWGSDLHEGPSNCPIANTKFVHWFDGWVKLMRDNEVVSYSKFR